ncbi:MAG: MetQ/NlpA family lipoprotein [Moraxella sp.]|nr:MetQ/NlpA family lipoprotein [Moraxella sp.]
MNIRKFFGICAITSSMALVGCTEDKPAVQAIAPASPNANTIKVGVMSGPEYLVAQTAATVAKEKYDLTVEYVQFNDYALPNAALAKGEIDANVMQHKAYLNKDTKSKNLDNLVAVGNTFVYPLAGYSKTITNVSELADGATVAIPNDPTNELRALILLEKQGLITIRDDSGDSAVSIDITSNPKNLNIKRVDTSVAARALDDVDLAVVNNTYAGQIGLSATDSIFIEGKDSPYVNLIVARTDNKDSQDIQNFVKAYQSDEVEAEAKRQFQDGVVKGW